MFADLEALMEIDRGHKPGGVRYDEDAVRLCELYEDRARACTLSHLKQLGVGNPDNPHPFSVPVLRRLVESLAVAYTTPPTRRLSRASRELGDSNPAVRALSEVYERMQVDQHWAEIDRLRTLYGCVAVTYVESAAHRSVQARIFEPFNILRSPNPRAADILDEDEVVAFCLRYDSELEKRRYEVWRRTPRGYVVAVCDGKGEVESMPYGDGTAPYAEIPAQMVYCDLPRGRAYLPISESRIAFALGTNAILNDLAYLIQQEAHTTLAVEDTGTRAGSVPTTVGPGTIWTVPPDSNPKTLATNPKIDEAGRVLDQTLRLFATGESLPADTFLTDRRVLTGQALKVQERPLAARRASLATMACEDERRAYRKIAMVHNAHAAEWGTPELALDVELSVSLGRAWQPVDPTELQRVYFGDLEAGAASIIDYLQERHGLTRDAAIRTYERVQEDRAAYPVEQNMAARIDGPDLPGIDSSRRGTGGLNLLPGSTEGASAIDAVRASVAGE